MAENDAERRSNFIREIIDADLEAGTNGGRVATRFPPEPNGYLHIGHAKSICLNFGLALDYKGTCNLRFDDTNPVKEDQEYVDSIAADVKWLGFDWPGEPKFASDYFEQMYDYAVALIHKGLAYVDSLDVETLREYRGRFDEPGRDSPYRTRSVEENLDLFARMRAGEFGDGEHVLRAKIDMAHPNMIMRDPPIYRIKHAHHHRTGDDWCIYPMYDFAHCLEDAIEDITHSICTLEFESNREFYDWVLDNGPTPSRPRQYEFARLGLDYTVMSKRKLLQLVEDEHVEGWDDPRMPTIAGLRRRGIRPEAIRTFCDLIGVSKHNSTVDIGKLEYCIRDDLNHEAPRAMAVLDPLKIVLTNYPEDQRDTLTANDWPHDVPKEGTREVTFSRELYVERSDFAMEPEKGWYRLAPGAEVRLRYAYVIRCEEVITDPVTGEVIELHCSYDPATRGGTTPDGRKVRGTIHWVCAETSKAAEVRLYDRLFDVMSPDGDPEVDFKTHLNPTSLVVLKSARVEPSLGSATAGERFQFERNGYFFVDPKLSTSGAPVFNRIITLKDAWARQSQAVEAPPSPAPRPRKRREQGTRTEAATRIDVRQVARDNNPELAARYELYKDQIGLTHEQADLLSSELPLAEFYDAACADAEADAKSVASWVINELLREAKERVLSDLPFAAKGFGELVNLVDDGTISRTAGKAVLEAMVSRGGSPQELIAELGLTQVSDRDALAEAIERVLASSEDEVTRYRGGEKRLLGFFMGRVMQETGGKANPQLVRELLADRLG